MLINKILETFSKLRTIIFNFANFHAFIYWKHSKLLQHYLHEYYCLSKDKSSASVYRYWYDTTYVVRYHVSY